MWRAASSACWPVRLPRRARRRSGAHAQAVGRRWLPRHAPMERGSAMPLCEARDVTVRFGGVVALDHITLEMLEGEFVALIRPNGAGKTTLFNVVSRIQLPASGAVIYARQPINDLDPSARARLGIGRTFQTPQAFSSLTVF